MPTARRAAGRPVVAGRRRSLQAARARHQQSPEGRLDHRDQQRAYRDRRRVMDQSSTTPRRCGQYPTGVTVTKSEMDAIALVPDEFHGDWN